MVVMEVMRVVKNGDHEPKSVLQMCRSTQAAEGRPRGGLSGRHTHPPRCPPAC